MWKAANNFVYEARYAIDETDSDKFMTYSTAGSTWSGTTTPGEKRSTSSGRS